MVGNKSIAPGAHGRRRLRLIQMHRLIEFEEAFDAYLKGECGSEHVGERARKMLQCGLPDFAAVPGKKK